MKAERPTETEWGLKRDTHSLEWRAPISWNTRRHMPATNVYLFIWHDKTVEKIGFIYFMPKTRLLFIYWQAFYSFLWTKKRENPIDCRLLFINRIYCAIKLDSHTGKSIKDPFYSYSFVIKKNCVSKQNYNQKMYYDFFGKL